MSGTPALPEKPGAWVDLGLTLPIFLVYHLGVVFLDIHNAADVVTFQIMRLAAGSRGLYLLFTAAIGVVFTGLFAWLGRGHAFRPAKFVQIAVEGVAYAFLMRLAGSYAVQELAQVTPKAAPLAPHAAHAVIVDPIVQAASSPISHAAPATSGVFTGLVMSLGAGFYEELAFRVLLFGVGAKIVVWLFAKERMGLVTAAPSGLSFRSVLVVIAWGIVGAALFSGMHYVGPLADNFVLSSFVFRFVLGVVLTLIYGLRGFAAAVWAHAVYDLSVLVHF